jgi:hypothetical protein
MQQLAIKPVQLKELPTEDVVYGASKLRVNPTSMPLSNKRPGMR